MLSSLCVFPLLGMNAQTQLEIPAQTSDPLPAPADQDKEYTEVPLESLNLKAQDYILNTESTGETWQWWYDIIFWTWGKKMFIPT